MGFLILGIALLALNFLGIGAIGRMQWPSPAWTLLIPFALAALWWWISDATGMTRRRAMAAIDAKREARRRKAMDALYGNKSASDARRGTRKRP